MIARKGVLAIANMAVGSILGLVAMFLIGHYFDPGSVGEAAYALGVLGILFFVTDLGMAQAHVKRVSEGRHAGDCFATYAVFKLATTAFFVLLAVAGYLTYTRVLGRTVEDTSPLVLAIALAFYIAKALQDIGQSSFEARIETAKAQLAGLLDTVVRVGLTALFAFFLGATVSGVGPLARFVDLDMPLVAWVHDHPGAALALTITAGGAAAATAALIMLARIFEHGRFRWELLKDYWSFALPLFLTSAAAIIAVNVDSALLGFFAGKEEVGVFAQVRRLPVVLQGVGSAIGILLFPTISAMAARGDHDGIQRSMDKALRYLSLFLVPTVAFLLLFPAEIINLLIGAKYVSGANALRVLSVYVIVVTFGYAHGTLLMGLNQPKVAARIGLLNALLVIVLDVILIPDDIRSLGLDLPGLGVLGASLGTLAAATVWYVGLRLANLNLVGYREQGHLWRHLAAAVAMSAGLLALDAFLMPFGRWFHIPIYAAAGAAVYFALLWAWGELTKEDVAYVTDAIHPGEMLRYVKGELRHRKR